MVDGGLPLTRAAVGAVLVQPLLDATLVIWRPDRGAYLNDTPRPTVRGHEAWRDSPFHHLWSRRRWRLCACGWARRATDSPF